MPVAEVSGFLPSRDGFPYPNAWPRVAPIHVGVGPLRVGIGDASRGLCGGMVFTVADLYAAGTPMPPDPTPAPDTPRFRYIVRRQVQSFDWLRLPLRFYLLMAAPAVSRRSYPLMPPPAAWPGRGAATAAWPAIRREIDAGRLAMLGLVRIASRNPF